MHWSTITPWLNDQWSDLRDHPLKWLIAGVVFLALFVVLRLILAVAKRQLKSFSERSKTQWDDALCKSLESTRNWFLLVVSACVALLSLGLSGFGPIIAGVIILALLFQGGLWGQALLEFQLGRYISRRMKTDPASATTISMVNFLAKLVLWTVVLLVALQNTGIDVTALIAGLGVGGIAIALASQHILGDLFSALSIVLDKPFVLGDFIVVGDLMGTVEKIGLKTTRLRSLSGEQLIFSNADLLQSRTRNFKRMNERRVVFSVGVTYQTPADTLEAIPRVIREIIVSHDNVRFDRSHFKEYGDSALTFETVYYVMTADYNRYMDIHQSINLAIYRAFEKQGIEFAYPTHTIFIENADNGTEPR
jgi:small-conductance mechanosensitive channel